tara:strand:- start:311 stop:1243 length:933 start_codon:yes stop_codon:yes gene_type:complete
MKKLIPYLFLVFTCNLFAADQESATRTLVWSDGTRYVGGVVDGKRSGKGTIFWQAGTRFVGEFENDMRNGPGTMIMPDGKVYSGVFKDDELIDTMVKIEVDIEDAPEVVASEDDEASIAATTEIEPIAAEPQREAVVESSIVEETIEAVEEVAVEEIIEETYEEEVVEPAETIALIPREEMPDVEDDPYQTVTRLTNRVRSEVTETVDLWGAAWSEQNVPQYLSNYSEDFAVPGNLSRRGWEALRGSRLIRPSYIDLEIAYGRIELIADNTIDVFFRQTYRSNLYRDKTDKKLRLQREEQGWRITEESSL